MMLSGLQIIEEMKTGKIVIDPFEPKQVNPNSVNLRLDKHLIVYDVKPRIVPCWPAITSAGYVKNSYTTYEDVYRLNGGIGQGRFGNELLEHPDHWLDPLDMKKDNPTRELIIPDEGLVLVPGQLYLGQTIEYTETHGFVPCIEGRSSIGRLGIAIHITAGYGDVGFCGTWTTEIQVTLPVRVYAGVQVCQICYQTVSENHVPYQSKKYQGQRTPKPSGLWKELQANDPAMGG